MDVSRMEVIRTSHNTWPEILKVTHHLGNRSRCDDNIKMCPRKVGWLKIETSEGFHNTCNFLILLKMN